MPVVAPAIGELGAFVALLVALGLVFIAYLLVRALFGIAGKAVGWIPWVGDKVQAPLHKIEQRLVNGLSEAITGLETGVAATWHVLAHTIAWMGHEIAATAKAVWRVWWYVTVKYPVSVAHSVAHAGQRTSIITKTVTKTLERRVVVASKAVAARTTALERWIDGTGAAIADAVTITLPHELDRLGGDVEAIGRAARNALRWAKRHERALGATAGAALVAIALRKLGATWIRCDNWRKLGRRVCGMDASYLDNLLAGGVALFGGFSIVQLAEALLAAEDEIVRGIAANIRELHGFEV